MMLQPSVLCLIGPTASGKTGLAVELAQQLPCEIISVDSAMVYRGLNIGTAKPGPDILQVAPHHLLDIRDPAEVYSVGDFQKDALCAIKAILQKNKVPLLVGGTMLYFYALEHGLAQLPEQNPALRGALQKEAEQKGWPALHEQLTTVDPAAASRIHPHDSQRIQRALEVYTLTGKSITVQQLQPEKLPYCFHHIILNPADRSHLHERIEKRFLAMLKQGFIDEVQTLYARPDLSLETPAIRAVGYRQAWFYLAGEYSFEEMKEKAISSTRQLAKRQITWLRRFENARYFDSEDTTLSQKVKVTIEKLL